MQASQTFITPGMVDAMAGKRVLVVGDLMLDAYLMGDAERLSPEAPVPVVNIEEERHCLGGAGNVARNVAALGGEVTLVGLCGHDEAASDMERLLTQEAIHSGLVRIKGRPTTVKTRVMARRQQMLRLDREDASPVREAALEAVLEQIATALAGQSVVIVSDYNKGLVTKAFMEGLRQRVQAVDPGIRLLVDPKPANMGLYGPVTLMTPNTKETGEGAGLPVRNKADVLAAGERILARHDCRHLLTTLGPDGMALFVHPDEVWHVPTMAQDVFDVTGAGDTVIATLGLGLAAGHELLPSCVLANYAAGLVVAKVGAAVVTPAALKEAIAALPQPPLTLWKGGLQPTDTTCA